MEKGREEKMKKPEVKSVPYVTAYLDGLDPPNKSTLSIVVGNGELYVTFSPRVSVSWAALSPDQADEMAEILTKGAEKARMVEAEMLIRNGQIARVLEGKLK
jgi:hypothetical protein